MYSIEDLRRIILTVHRVGRSHRRCRGSCWDLPRRTVDWTSTGRNTATSQSPRQLRSITRQSYDSALKQWVVLLCLHFNSPKIWINHYLWLLIFNAIFLQASTTHICLPICHLPCNIHCQIFYIVFPVKCFSTGVAYQSKVDVFDKYSACLFVNMLTSEQLNAGWWNSVSSCTVQKFGQVQISES